MDWEPKRDIRKVMRLSCSEQVRIVKINQPMDGYTEAHACAWHSYQPVLSDPQLHAFIAECPLPAITLVPPENHSKQCLQDLVTSPMGLGSSIETQTSTKEGPIKHK
jgi:hypothetical protein